MTFDLTFSITAIIALSAIISPSITAWINNKHALKISEINFNEKELTEFNLHKRKLIEQFMITVGRATRDSNYHSINDLIEAFYALLPHLPEEKIDLFSSFCNDILSTYFESQELQLDKVNNRLNKEIIPVIKKMLKE